jgi:hypothetical protein
MAPPCHARYRADLLALRGDAPRRAASKHAHPCPPIQRRAWSAHGISDVDVAPKADHIAKVQFVEEGEKLLIAKNSVGQNSDTAAGWNEFGQAPRASVLEAVALFRDLVFPDAQPQQGRGPAVAGDQAQHKG